MERTLSLEEKEIRGLNFKLLRALIIGVSTVVASVMFSYYNLRFSIREIQTKQDGNDKYNDLRLKTIELNLNSIQLQVDNIRSEVNQNTKTRLNLEQ